MGLWEMPTLSGFMHNLIIFPVKLFFYQNMNRRISDSCLILYPFHCLSWIKMQEVAAVLLTWSLHASLCSLLNMSWHVFHYVSICSLGLQWFLNSALLSRFPVCLNQLKLLFLATKGNWNSNFFFHVIDPQEEYWCELSVIFSFPHPPKPLRGKAAVMVCGSINL